MLSSEERSLQKTEELRWFSSNSTQNMDDGADALVRSVGKDTFSQNRSATSLTAEKLLTADYKNKQNSQLEYISELPIRRNYKDYKKDTKSNKGWKHGGFKLRRKGFWTDTIEYILSSMQDSKKVLCVKATSHTFATPESERIRAIIRALQNHEDDPGEDTIIENIVYYLQRRLFSDDWVVTLKALGIFHHLSRHDDELFVDYIAQNRRRIFRTDFFPVTTKEGVSHNVFIKCYSAYIERLLAMKTILNFPLFQLYEIGLAKPKRYQHFSILELITVMPVIMDTLEVLNNIPLESRTSRTSVAALSISMIMKDVDVLSTALYDGLRRLIDLYFDENRYLAAEAYEVYERSVDLLLKLRQSFGLPQRLAKHCRAPRLDFVSAQLLAAMQEHIGRVCEGEGCKTSTVSAMSANRLNEGKGIRRENEREIGTGTLQKGNLQRTIDAPLLDSVGSEAPDTVAFVAPHALRWSAGTFVYEGMSNVFDGNIRVRETCIILSKTKWESVMTNLSKNHWKFVCTKATNNLLAPLAGKQVESILGALNSSSNCIRHQSPVEAIFHCLKERMYTLDYCHIIKSQTIFHHIFREGEDAVIKYIGARSRRIFATDLFANETRYSIFRDTFIESYGRYLEKRLTMMVETHFPHPPCDENDPTIRKAFKQGTTDNVIKVLPLLMDTAHTLTNIPIDGLVAHAPVASVATSMLFSDLTVLLTAIFNSVIRLLDLHMALPRSNAALALKLYARFTTLLSNMRPFLTAMQARTIGCRVPVLDDVCLQLGRTIREHVERPHGSESDCETYVTSIVRILLRRISSNGGAFEKAERNMHALVGGQGKNLCDQDESICRNGLLAEIDILFHNEVGASLPVCAAETMQIKVRERYKGAVARVQKDVWYYVVMKATSGEARVPRHEYVRSLLLGLMWGGNVSGRMSAVGSIVYHLRERLLSAEWITVVRALALFHYVLRGSASRFWEQFEGEWSEVFEVKGLEDRMGKEGLTHVEFIRAYGAYVKQWLRTRRVLDDLMNEAMSRDDESTRTGIVLGNLEEVLDTVEAALRVEEAGGRRGECGVAVSAMGMIGKDLEMIWGIVLRGVEWILKEFVEMKYEDEMVGLEIYKRAVAMAAEVSRLLERLREDGK